MPKNKFGFEVRENPILAKAIDEFTHVEPDNPIHAYREKVTYTDYHLFYSHERYKIKHMFVSFLSFDNWDAVTLKPRPEFWSILKLTDLARKVSAYCMNRKLEFYMVKEIGLGTNAHYHGIMGFPSSMHKKNFQNWFNKNYGTMKTSQKPSSTRIDFIDCIALGGWYEYIHKQHKANKTEGLSGKDIPYIFE